MSDDLHERVGGLESKVDTLERRADKVENLVTRIHDDMGKMRSDLRDDMVELKRAALEAVPAWAAKAMGRNHMMVGALVALLGVSVTIAIWAIFHAAA